MPHSIQRATPAQSDQLTRITVMAKRHWGYPEKWIQEWLPVLAISAEYITENETWAAQVRDRPVAYYSLKQVQGGLWLDNLWVLPECMGQGLGRSLFAHALERARIRGATNLLIEADPNAEGFYARMGARKVGERPHDRMDGQPRILPVMEMML